MILPEAAGRFVLYTYNDTLRHTHYIRTFVPAFSAGLPAEMNFTIVRSKVFAGLCASRSRVSTRVPSTFEPIGVPGSESLVPP
jgi:hypothetical protein